MRRGGKTLMVSNFGTFSERRHDKHGSERVNLSVRAKRPCRAEACQAVAQWRYQRVGATQWATRCSGVKGGLADIITD